MTITSNVQNQFFDKNTNKVISLPPRSSHNFVPIAPAATNPAAVSPAGSTGSTSSNNGTPWTEDEHARFLQGLELFPSGPWKAIANCVGTRTPRQTMSHAQKYRQRIARKTQRIAATATLPLRESNGKSLTALEDPLDLLDDAAMEQSFAEMHLTNEVIDEIIMSLFEDDGKPLVITQEDMDAIMGVH
ncbi:Myb-like dna-binding protein, partial [Globisporangium splendens]